MTDTNLRTFYVCNELGLDVLISARLSAGKFHIFIESLPDDLADLPDDGTGIIYLEPADVGPMTPDVMAIVKQGKPFVVLPEDDDLTTWHEPMKLHDHCLAESDDLGFLLKLMTVQEVGDEFPTLVLARGPRIFRLASELAVPVQVVYRLERNRFTMAIDQDPRERPAFGAAMVASTHLFDEDSRDPYNHRVVEFDDGEADEAVSSSKSQRTFVMEPGGYLTVVLAGGELPTWHEAKDLMDSVQADMNEDAPDAVIDLFYPPHDGLLTTVIIAPETMVAN